MKQQKNNQLAIIMMMLHAFAAASLFVTIKHLSQSFDSNFAVFLYKLIALFLLLPWILSKGGIRNLYTKSLFIYLIGAISGTSATLLLMYGLKFLPVANVTVLGYLEKILLIIIGIFYYHEKISKDIVAAISICILGAIIVVLPNLSWQLEFNSHYYYIFASIILWVFYCLTVKYLGSSDNLKCQTFYTIFLSCVLSFMVAYFTAKDKPFYPELTINHLALFFICSSFYIIISTSLFKSFRSGDLAIITPFGYTKVVFASILGYFFFKETPSLIQVLGYLLIVISSWYIARKKIEK